LLALLQGSRGLVELLLQRPDLGSDLLHQLLVLLLALVLAQRQLRHLFAGDLKVLLDLLLHALAVLELHTRVLQLVLRVQAVVRDQLKLLPSRLQLLL